MPELSEPGLNLLHGSIAIALTLLVLLTYYLITISKAINKKLQQVFSEENFPVRMILLHRLSGAVLFGLIPALVILLVFQMPVSIFGSNTDNLSKSIIWWAPAALLVIVLNNFASRDLNHLSQYPQIRVNQWDSGLIILSALSWIAYLAGYEFLFRGFLLFSCLESFGYWPAIIINICLYSLAHLPKGYKETIGSILLGFILSYVTLSLGSIWFALLVHITLALTGEWFSIKFHPEMNRIKKPGPR